ncbi:transcriptional activator DEMETER [Lycium barbarum]|uniref:transcriptional activator DEMETER n=1 Tax=Lycium barbarum TaxID=112863 RepID=UPI00293E32F4|nr:transcriptional activator DEMETER [Lycium barbarum]
MNLGRIFSTPQENRVTQNGDPWTPITPQKPVLQIPDLVPAEMQGNQMERTDWQDLLGMYGDFLQKPSHDTGAVQNPVPSVSLNNGYIGHRNDAAVVNRHSDIDINRCENVADHSKPACTRVNSLAELLGMNQSYTLSTNGRSSNSIHLGDLPTFQNSYSQVESRYEQQLNSAGQNLLNESQVFSPNQAFDRYSNQRPPLDGIRGPYQINRSLYSPSAPDAGTSPSTSSFFPFAPVTPEQNHFKDNQHFEPIQESSSLDKDKQEHIVGSMQSKDNHSDKLLQKVPDSTVAVSPLSEKINSDNIGNGDIDLNKTPASKPPKRRKHRPKVVIEGQTKRTPKPAAQKDSSHVENPSGKRKYVRRNGLKASTTEQTEVVESAAPGNSIRDENPSGKRKYVRRKGLKASTTQQTEVVDKDRVPDAGDTAKTCRKMLNFDLEDRIKDESLASTNISHAEKHQPRKEFFDLNLNSQDMESALAIMEAPEMSAGQNQQNGEIAEKLLTETTSDVISSFTQKPKDLALPLPSANKVTTKNQALNAIARSLSMRNVNQYPNSIQLGHDQVRIDETRIGQVVFQAKDSTPKRDEPRQLALERTPLLLKDTACADDKRGSKRDQCSSPAFQPRIFSQMGSLCPEMSGIDCIRRNYSTFGLEGSEIHKKTKFDSEIYGNSSGIPSCTTAAIDGSTKFQSSSLNINRYNGFLGSNNSGANGEGSRHCASTMVVKHNFQKQPNPSQSHSYTQPISQDISQQMTGIHEPQAQATSSNWNLQCQPQTLSMVAQEILRRFSKNKIQAELKNVGRTSSNELFSHGELLTRENKNSRADQHHPTKARGLQGTRRNAASVDMITRRLEHLVISGGKKDAAEEDQKALVPYKASGTIIPYEGFDPVKKHKPRPKVDLDPETNRLWDLLMGKEGNADTTDKDNEKKWEDERKVIRGRVDSFITRMRLVQGDRRFSPWKGSVVDSVIGVFLTQNVSDHLSSSAFMCLAAKFPLQPTRTKNTLSRNGCNIAVEEPEVEIIDPDGTTTYHKARLQLPTCHQRSITSNESSEHRMENHIQTTRAYLVSEHGKRTDEEVISLQNSPDSLILQANEEIRSSSGSNSECEDQPSSPNLNENSTRANHSPPTKWTAAFQEYQSHFMRNTLSGKMPVFGNQKSENVRHNRNLDAEAYLHGYPINPHAHVQEISVRTTSNSWLTMRPEFGKHEIACHEKEIASSLTPITPELNAAKGVDLMSQSINQIAGCSSTLTAQRTALPVIHEPRMGEYAFAEHREQTGTMQMQPHNGNDQHSESSQQKEMTMASHLESACIRQSVNHSEAAAKGQEEGQAYLSSKQPRVTGTSISKPRKRKVEEGDKKAFDWDSLRKEVQPKSGKTEKSKNAMDSLNYEAVRCAAVKEISDAIKERGMNNMLAERIKDFLNRLVRDHGSIDLEWLRDVAPEKAKEYLLSIRGLGLKSVECVRLLTLHNLAFPVDTNVGRIAVRLGWVPLRPLPESLQLHLLELYPVLESVQKYLWPRLCKLDQRTLYELHYHMITFGKVFCTKSKPNCNACPLRAECRHFASAFASARLALPGPEEKRIVSSAVPISGEGNATAPFKPMLLPPAAEGRMMFPCASVEAGNIPAFLNKPMPVPQEITNLSDREATLITSNCEPIIEEPKTPEPLPELLESDIEDGFIEDPDEIPMIELNMKEFTTNLETIFQGHNKEGDLSKALVALNPDAASIPTPKLKNVSRLRTEHQVYELPDSHELLEKMDKREPDDPSPYLLAIWTPGETVNSIQPPETKCDPSGSGSLCNEKTCYSCNGIREANSQTVRGTLLIPCRTAMRGSFPLNGTYFQVNEVFADHKSSLNPINVPRKLLWSLPRRTVYFGTSVTTIFKGLSTEQIQYCFWRGFVCVRGFDQETRAPRPLIARLHFPTSKLVKNRSDDKKKEGAAAERVAGYNSPKSAHTK